MTARVATNAVRDPFPLIHPHVINVHPRRELQVFEVLLLEVGWKTRHINYSDHITHKKYVRAMPRLKIMYYEVNKVSTDCA